MDTIRFRIPDDIKRELRAKLAFDGMNLTDFFMDAAQTYLEKSRNIIFKKSKPNLRRQHGRESKK